MKAMLPVLLAAILLSARVWAGEPRLLMVDAEHGWKFVYAEKTFSLMRTDDGGSHWSDVSPPVLAKAAQKETSDDFEPLASIAPLDAQRAWLAVSLGDRVVMEFTSTGGREWRETAGPLAMYGKTFPFFFNESEGFLLVTSDEAMGHQKKQLYHTADAGRHWDDLGALSLGSCYATGVSFRTPQQGWVTATYHGEPDVPFFRTTDGGKSWQAQTIGLPAGFHGGYGNVYPPVFIGKDHLDGYLPIHFVQSNPRPGRFAWVNYISHDGGASWQPPPGGVASYPETPPEDKGLACELVIPPPGKIVDGELPVRLILKNVSPAPLRIETKCGRWAGVSADWTEVRFTSYFKSDGPAEDDEKGREVVTLDPGQSFTIDSACVVPKKDPFLLNVSYGIMDEIGRKLHTWSGYIGPPTVLIQLQPEFKVTPADTVEASGKQGAE